LTRNSLTIPWTNEILLLHPPIDLIPKTISKLIRDKAIGILILPNWCTIKYRMMIPRIQDHLILGPAKQILAREKSMKEEEKLPPGIIGLIVINTLKESEYSSN
jgi:hypothetical protein